MSRQISFKLKRCKILHTAAQPCEGKNATPFPVLPVSSLPCLLSFFPVVSLHAVSFPFLYFAVSCVSLKLANLTPSISTVTFTFLLLLHDRFSLINNFFLLLSNLFVAVR